MVPTFTAALVFSVLLAFMICSSDRNNQLREGNNQLWEENSTTSSNMSPIVIVAIVCLAAGCLVLGVLWCIMYGKYRPFKQKYERLHQVNEQLKDENERLHQVNEQLKDENGEFKHKYEISQQDNNLLSARFYRADVVLDPETAHRRLEVFENGKCVKDTGQVSKVLKDEKRFDSRLFVLAKDGFSKGKHYWEVKVGKRKHWCLGVASESIGRKGTITLSPQNGYWVIQLEDGRNFMAQTTPPIPLAVNSKPKIIGIFLNISARSLVFYDVQSKIYLYTFSNANFSGKLYPLFSTGSARVELDTDPLRIPPWFDEEVV